MIAKNILVATLGLSTIALYSCGGKNNNKTPAVAASEKSNKEEKKPIKVNFSSLLKSAAPVETAVTSASIIVNCGNDKAFNLTATNQIIEVLSNTVCSLKISEFNGYTAADPLKPLTLTLKKNGNIDKNIAHTKFTNSAGNTFYLNAKKVGEIFTIYVATETKFLDAVLKGPDAVDPEPAASTKDIQVQKFDNVAENYSSVSLTGNYNVKRGFGSLKHRIETNFRLEGLTVTASDCRITEGVHADMTGGALTDCIATSVSKPIAYTIFVKDLEGTYERFEIPERPVPADLELADVQNEKDLLTGYFNSVNEHLTRRIVGENTKIAGLKTAYDNDATDASLAAAKGNIDAEIVKINAHVNSTTLLDKAGLENINTVLEANKTANADVTAYVEALIEKVKLLIEIEDKSKLYENRDAAK